MNKDDKSFLSLGAFIFGGIALVFGGYALAVSPSDSAKTVQTAATEAATVVDISLKEFSMSPMMPTVPPGDVTIRVTNNGTIAHNFAVPDRSVTTGDLQPGESKTVTVKNATEGELAFICTIPAHADSGMKGMLMVETGAAASGSDSSSATETTVMTNEQMDAAMEERALRFVNEKKGTFGGTPLAPKVLADGTKEFDLTAEIVDWEVEPGKSSRRGPTTAWFPDRR